MHRMQSRFVVLVDPNGKPVCPPIIVEFADLSYLASDSEFELKAIKIAVADGLLSASQIGAVHARVEV
jgi:hypothetical protein